MTTILTHPAIPIALAVASRGFLPRRLLMTGIFLSVLPDVDVIAFRLGIAYGDAFGHRGMTHSIVFALLIALIASGACRLLGVTFRQAFPFLFLCIMSHGVLDAFTNGGLGVAFLWPFSDTRFFAPWRPIAVSPFFSQFFSERGLAVLKSEILWVWFPSLFFAAFAALFRRR